MARQLVCPHGHQWEADGSHTPALCPVCSAPAVTANPRTEDFAPKPPGALTLPPTTPAPDDEATELPTVPGFDVMGELGRGGMGVVYWAWQPELNRAVALKMVLTGAHAGSQELARFRTEAEAVGRLQHPNIVQIYGVGRHDDHPYLVLEYVDGGSLAQQLTGTPFPVRKAAELVETLARAVHYAHERGIVHRDLTPGNVLLTADGQPKITDFGLAKLLVGGGAVRTQSGAIVGTPSYMAPEQAAGRTKEIGPAADVYGLGAILYELLTGRPPFKAETPLETLLQVQADEPVPPSRLQLKLPRDLGTICLKALAKSLVRRYSSAGELADDLQRWLDGEPIRARPVSTWERSVAWVKRRPAVAALLLVSGLAALALVGVGVALFYNAQLQEQRTRAEEERDKANFHAYFHHIARAYAGWREGNMVQVEELLNACPLDLRDWEWDYLKRLCHTDLLTLKDPTETPRGEASHGGVAYSPDGTRLASVSSDNTVKVWDAVTGQKVLTLAPHEDKVSGVVYSPDGRTLASTSLDMTVRVWDATTGQLLHKLEGHTSYILCPAAFSPDGLRLVSGGYDKTVRVWDVTTGQEVHKLEGHTDLVNGVAYSPDGRWLASAGHDRTVRGWDATTGHPVFPPLRHSTSPVRAVAFSPDGCQLASGSDDGTVIVWEVATGQLTRALTGHSSGVLSVAFSPDGRQLASASAEGVIKVWDVTSAQELLTLKGHTHGAGSVAFSPDGMQLATASADGTVKLWDAMREPEARTLKGHSGEVYNLAFSPDGRQLATASAEGTVRLWDVTTGQEIRTLPGHRGDVYGVAFCPDSNWLASAGRDRTVRIWDAQTGRELLQLPVQSAEVVSVAFSPDGQWLASAGFDKTAKLWEARTGQLIHDLLGHEGRVFHVAFSPDGTQLTSASMDGTVRLWNVRTGQPIRSLEGRLVPFRLAFSPDGTRLATSNPGPTIKLWDVSTGQLSRTFEGNATGVFGNAFSPDGRRLASASADGMVKLWDVASGQEALVLRGHICAAVPVAFSPDGFRLATADSGGTVKLWDARPWGATAAIEREALGLLDGLFAKPLRESQVRDYLHKSPTIRPQARQLALSLLDRYREETDPEEYHQASWAIVRQPYLNAFQYGFALKQAQAASELAPDQAKYRTALGRAHYRLGRYKEALATLTQADQSGAGNPAALVFLAMTQHQLGHKEQAQTTLARLRQILGKPPLEKNEETQVLLREAESLLGHQP